MSKIHEYVVKTIEHGTKSQIEDCADLVEAAMLDKVEDIGSLLLSRTAIDSDDFSLRIMIMNKLEELEGNIEEYRRLLKCLQS